MTQPHRIYRIDVTAPKLTLHCDWCSSMTEHTCDHGYWSHPRRTGVWHWCIVADCDVCGYRRTVSLPVTDDGDVQAPLF